MLDLRRFPVSDGAGVKCCTFCTILDRFFLEFLSSHILKNVNFLDESMEMSEIEF